jgi:sodium/proline symporter
MFAYLAAMVSIGFYFSKRANESSSNYFLGGRGLGPWVAALSAEASDMSGWLLMGLPGVAYFYGASDAAWTAIGLAIGTYINWLAVAKPLRQYSQAAGNSITLPDFFSNRFREIKSKPLLIVSSAIILIFFSVYTGSCFVSGGKLFSAMFGLNYQIMMASGAAVVILYTFMGGFLAESMSDFIQGIVMFFAIICVFAAGVIAAGGLGAVFENIKGIPGFTTLFGIASPTLNAEGVQEAANGLPQFGGAGAYGFITILSTMSWGLGYFGMPQVTLRFMAIQDPGALKRSRRIAIVWCAISEACAVLIGLIGRSLYPVEASLNTAAKAENVFIFISQSLFHPAVSGIMMAGILAAIMSSADSYLLIASSAVAKCLYQGVFRRKATDKQVMRVSKIAMLAISILALAIALDENSVIFTIVSFAWAGLGASFGPITLFSLFWRRTTKEGALAGLLGGTGMVFFYKFVMRPLGGGWNIYELLPAFLFSSLLIWCVSLLTKEPSKEILRDFDKIKALR